MAVGLAVGLGSGVDADADVGVRSSGACRSELVNTLVQPIKRSAQMPNETNSSAGCPDFR